MYKVELSLNLEELNLSLPDVRTHVHWRDVHSASVVQERHWIILKRPRVHVVLNDGLVAKLHVPRDDCEPLADLMRELIVCHRGNH